MYTVRKRNDSLSGAVRTWSVFCIHVDNVENEVLKGRVTDLLHEEQTFNGAEAIAAFVDSSLASNDDEVFDEVRKSGSPNFLRVGKRGKLLSCFIHILYTQRDTWQGQVRFMDEANREYCFKSRRELFDRIREKTGTPVDGLRTSS